MFNRFVMEDADIEEEKSSKVNLGDLLKHNPNHEPAGSSKGGQFASASSQAGFFDGADNLTLDEALLNYTFSGYRHVNFILRQNVKHLGELKINDEVNVIGTKDQIEIQNNYAKGTIKRLDEAFDNKKEHLVADRKMEVQRGVMSKELFEKFSKWEADGSGEGKVIGDKAFMSTSRSFNVSRDSFTSNSSPIVLVIKVPKGTKYLNGNAKEAEAIFERGTQLKVTGIKRFTDENMITGTQGVRVMAEIVGVSKMRTVWMALSPPWAEEKSSKVNLGTLLKANPYHDPDNGRFTTAHSGVLFGYDAKGKKVEFKFKVKAKDHYEAGDKAKAAAERKHGPLIHIVMRHNQKQNLTFDSATRSVVSGAGAEES